MTICFPSEGAGGPDLQLTPDIRAEFWIDEVAADCRIIVNVIDNEYVKSAREYNATVLLIHPEYFGDLLAVGQEFLIKRGSRIYAHGSISQMGVIEAD